MTARTRSTDTRPAGRGRGTRTLGYASVPGGSALDGPEVDAQVAGIEAACGELGLKLVSLVRDHEPNGVGGRPELSRALQLIDAGDASCLIVSDLERLSRRVGELATVVDRIERARGRLIALDVGLDTATPSGRLAIAAPQAEPAEAPAPAEPPADAPVDAAPEPVPAPHAAPEPDAALESVPKPEPDAALETVPAPEPDAELVAPLELVSVPAPEPDAEPAAPPEPVPLLVPEPAAVTEPLRPPQPPEPAAPAKAPAVVSAIGYASVPTEGTANGLDEQKRIIERDGKRLGFELVEIVQEREPKTGGALDRAGLSYVIERIAAGDATCVVVAALERLSRSVSELGTIIQWLERNGVRLVAVDIALDTASPGGHATARALASVARWEHERLSERTRSGLAAARAKRHAAGGSSGPDWTEVRERIAKMRADGMTLKAIADVLNAEGVPTQRGGAEWRPSSVQTAAGYKRRSRPKKFEDLPNVDRSAPE